MRTQKAIAKYMDYLSSGQASQGTIRNYRQTLTRFVAVVGNPHLEDVTREDVERYFTARMAGRTTPLSAGTINHETSMLRTFFAWCEGRRYVVGNPTLERRRLKTPGRKRLRVAAEHFPRLLDAAEHGTDRMAIALGIYLLIRQSEIKLIRVGDVDLRHGTIEVLMVKTGERDSMPISSELDTELRRWFISYAAALGRPLEPSDHLVPRKSRPVRTVEGVRYVLNPAKSLDKIHLIVQRTLVRAGYAPQKGEGAHTLRRSAARALFDQLSADGHDRALRHVQTMLHHANLTQTEVYLGLEHDRAKRDALIRGKTMYVQGETANVIPLRREI